MKDLKIINLLEETTGKALFSINFGNFFLYCPSDKENKSKNKLKEKKPQMWPN